jgi:glyceraldehyde 3-phosphate dehydrogenase
MDILKAGLYTGMPEEEPDMLKIAVNGFGRIGRAVSRLILQSGDCELVFINELDPDIRNLAYLLRYDSIYGRFNRKVETDEKKNSILCDGAPVKMYSFPGIEDIPFGSHKIDVLIDATGITDNAGSIRRFLRRPVPKAILTHSPPADKVDMTMIMGVNESSYRMGSHHLISSSICDAAAIAPVLSELDAVWGIENCFITTLHPWLSYQNLLDGPVSSVSSPGHFWKDYALGRNSAMNLILKETTVASAVLKVMPGLKDRIDAISFRVPTNIVAASDLTVVVRKKTSVQEIRSHMKSASRLKERIIGLEEESLVSMDYLGTDRSVTIDSKHIRVLNGKAVKMVLWYDNEWGYSSRVLDIARFIARNGPGNRTKAGAGKTG